MKYGRLENNIVLEVFTPPEGFTLAECFHPVIVAQFVEVPQNVEALWVRGEDGTFSEPSNEQPA